MTKLPGSIELSPSYDGAFLLLRYYGKPVGTVILPATKGKILVSDHLKEIRRAVEQRLKSASVDHFLFPDAYPKPPSYPVTVAVCTRNRTEDLKLCLEALFNLPDRGQEILVVDNAPSTDDTQKLVERYPRVRYIRENRKGLNRARNRALAEASNEIVAFTDDDAVPEPQWLDRLIINFEDPLVMCVTGMTLPLELETEAQEKFEAYSPFGKGFYKKHYSFSYSDPLATGQIGAGANMAVRKNVTIDCGWFDEALDAGTPTQSGGDHEFFARVLLAGYHIIYDPEAISWHRHRRTWKEAVQAIRGYGVGVYAFWTRLFFIEKQYSIVLFSKGWLLHTQLPNLARAVLGLKNHYPLSFLLAEFQGCLRGPFAYFRSRKQKNESVKKQSG